ncbi:MAG: exodeoxyribonuclease VII large subunit [Alphaproteobacteria bacterium]|nr:exodeoxyribonuclease VII large subunit [Alphaproteobacteria bacterium]
MKKSGIFMGVPTDDNQVEYSVTELSMLLKRTVEGKFGHVRLRGEISGFKRAASGHIYLALKDDRSVLDGVMWKGVAARLNFRPEDGLEVVCSGKLTTYPGRSKYQIVIEQMAVAGVGALMALLEERRQKLAAEGLFDPARKKAIPYLPTVIGVVTSPTGSVISDILHRLSARFPRHVIVWPVVVQGEKAAEQVARAIRGFNELTNDGPIPRPDVVIVARGGGSLEDLWPFNEEGVVRAVAAGDIPLISAVGHETDTMLIDYAADLRAPTPTAAAELAVPVRDDLIYALSDFDRRLGRAVRRSIEERGQRLEGLARGLPKPADMLALNRQRLDDIVARLPRAACQLIERRQLKLDGLGRLFDSLNYRKVLERGYAVIRNDHGRAVTQAAALPAGSGLDIEFYDGHVRAVAAGGIKKKKTVKNNDDRQGSLL